jgi:beta-galactosidase/beta-glucuronidase
LRIAVDITGNLKATNELLVYVFDPSDSGSQPNGKQRITAIDHPGGDTYTPSSGIWQTVWLEAVPATYIESVTVGQASLTAVDFTVTTAGAAAGTGSVEFEVTLDGASVVKGKGKVGEKTSITIPSPKLWSTESPTLYDVNITAGGDTVVSYFGLRTFALGDGPKGKRPLLNGKFVFAAGFLDQSWWPDGQYTAPTDEGLAYDIKAVPMFGLNMIRLHQKVNPEVSTHPPPPRMCGGWVCLSAACLRAAEMVLPRRQDRRAGVSVVTPPHCAALGRHPIGRRQYRDV